MFASDPTRACKMLWVNVTKFIKTQEIKASIAANGFKHHYFINFNEPTSSTVQVAQE